MPVVLALLPFLTALIPIVERWIARPKAGAEKKRLVLDSVATLLEGVNAATRTTEIDTPAERAVLMEAVSKTIDSIVAINHARGLFTSSTPAEGHPSGGQ